MTTVAIMQPYLFPYIGYYQLVAAADIFVFLDDVNFRKGSFINRNYIVDRTGKATRFTLPVRDQSPNRKINEHIYADPRQKPTKTFRQCYGSARGFEEYYPLFEDVFSTAEGKPVSEVNARSIRLVADHLRLETKFVTASAIDPDWSGRGQERILELCQRLGASRYLNLPGGRALYDPADFHARGLELEFVEAAIPPTRLPDGECIHLSLLHHVMSFPLDTRQCLGVNWRGSACGHPLNREPHRHQ